MRARISKEKKGDTSTAVSKKSHFQGELAQMYRQTTELECLVMSIMWIPAFDLPMS